MLHCPGQLFTVGRTPKVPAGIGGTVAVVLAPYGHFDGSGALDSDQTELADPPEDWPAADLPAAQRLLWSFRSLLLRFHASHNRAKHECGSSV